MLEFIQAFLSMRILFARMVWGRDLMLLPYKWWTGVFKIEDKQSIFSQGFIVSPWGPDRERWHACKGVFWKMCVCVCLCVFRCFSHVWLFETPRTVAHQAPMSMGFSRQEYWSGLPFPSPGNLPDPGIELGSPAWQADSLLSEPPEKASKLNSDSNRTNSLCFSSSPVLFLLCRRLFFPIYTLENLCVKICKILLALLKAVLDWRIFFLKK